MQELGNSQLWHSNNIPKSSSFPLNSTLHINNHNNNQSIIPFNHVVSDVLNNNYQQRFSPNRTNVYKQPLVAVVDVLQQHSESLVPNSASILTPNISATGPSGNCVSALINQFD